MANKSSKAMAHGLLAAVLLAGIVLRLFHLGDQSLWFDEALSLGIAKGSLSQILRSAFPDVHPPAYHLLLHFWLLLGVDDFLVRLPSLLFGSLAILAIYHLGTYALDRRCGLLAAAITALSPFQVYYSQELRMYSLLTLGTLLLLYGYYRALKEATFLWWLVYLLSALLTLYTHYLSFLTLLALHLYFLVRWRTLKRLLRNLLLADLAVLLLYLPWIDFFWESLTEIARGYWVEEPSLGRLLSTPYTFLLGSSASPALVTTGFVLVLALLITTLLQVGRTLYKKEAGSSFLALLLLSFGVPLLTAYLISYFRSIYLERALSGAAPALYLLLAWGALRARERLVNLVLCLAVGLLAINALWNWYLDPSYSKPQLREAALFLEKRAAPGEMLLHTSDGSYIVFLHYLPGRGFLVAGDPGQRWPVEAVRLFGGELMAKEEVVAPFWLVVELDHSIKYQREMVAWFDARYRRVDRRDFRGVEVLYYDAGEG